MVVRRNISKMADLNINYAYILELEEKELLFYETLYTGSVPFKQKLG